MGWECYYSGTLPDIILQEKVINFVKTFFDDPPDLIVTPYPNIKYETKIGYRKRLEEIIPSCCNEKVLWQWKGYARCEQFIPDYPCDYYGIIQACDRQRGTIYYGDFNFDRTAGGVLVRFENFPPVYRETLKGNERADEPSKPELPVEITHGGNVREMYGFPLLLNIIKLRWWPDLECSDDDDMCLEILHDICKYGLEKQLMDENIDYDECVKLMNNERKKNSPPPPKDPLPEKKAPVQKIVPDGILAWPIAELDLSIRTSHCLEALNIKTIGDLMQKSEVELLKQKNLGRKSVAELAEVLSEYGLALKKDN